MRNMCASTPSKSVGPNEYIENHPDRVEHFLNIRMNNLPALEDYLHHVVARQACDLSHRLKEITQPMLVIVGAEDHGSATGASHRETSEAMAKELRNGSFAVIANEAHNYFMTNPDEAHRIIREFLVSSLWRVLEIRHAKIRNLLLDNFSTANLEVRDKIRREARYARQNPPYRHVYAQSCRRR